MLSIAMPESFFNSSIAGCEVPRKPVLLVEAGTQTPRKTYPVTYLAFFATFATMTAGTVTRHTAMDCLFIHFSRSKGVNGSQSK
jgi:hypothetical protein